MHRPKSGRVCSRHRNRTLVPRGTRFWQELTKCGLRNRFPINPTQTFCLCSTVSPPKIVSRAAVPNLRRSGSSRREHSNGQNQFSLVARRFLSANCPFLVQHPPTFSQIDDQQCNRDTQEGAGYAENRPCHCRSRISGAIVICRETHRN